MVGMKSEGEGAQLDLLFLGNSCRASTEEIVFPDVWAEKMGDEINRKYHENLYAENFLTICKRLSKWEQISISS